MIAERWWLCLRHLWCRLPFPYLDRASFICTICVSTSYPHTPDAAHRVTPDGVDQVWAQDALICDAGDLPSVLQLCASASAARGACLPAQPTMSSFGGVPVSTAVGSAPVYNVAADTSNSFPNCSPVLSSAASSRHASACARMSSAGGVCVLPCRSSSLWPSQGQSGTLTQPLSLIACHKRRRCPRIIGFTTRRINQIQEHHSEYKTMPRKFVVVCRGRRRNWIASYG